MDAKFEWIVERANASGLAKFRGVNGWRCAAIGMRKRCGVEWIQDFAGTRVEFAIRTNAQRANRAGWISNLNQL
jgi:hypothetical protein